MSNNKQFVQNLVCTKVRDIQEKSLNNGLDILRREVEDELSKFDQYTKKTKLVTKYSPVRWKNKYKINIFSMYRYLFRLRLDLSGLNVLLDECKEKKLNLEILIKVNSLIFVRSLKYNKYLNKLSNVLVENNYDFRININDSNSLEIIDEFWDSVNFNEYSNGIFHVELQDHYTSYGVWKSTLTERIRYLHSRLSIGYLNKVDFDVPIVNLSTPIKEKECNDFHMLFHSEMINKLKSGWYTDNEENRLRYKKNEWLYLVNFNILYKNINGKKTPDTLIYSYYKYNPIFSYPLVRYLEEITVMDALFMNVNTTIFNIDNSMRDFSRWDRESSSEFYMHNSDYFYGKNNRNKLNLIESIASMSYGGPMYSSIENLSQVIRYLFEGDVIKVWKYSRKFFLDVMGFNVEYKKGNISLNIRKSNVNAIFNFVFLVKDLDRLKELLKDLKVNEGPQKNRGLCDLSKANLTRNDMGFRKSLYLSCDTLRTGLKKRDFSYKNVHMNLGDVRYFSTNTKKPFHRCMQSEFLTGEKGNKLGADKISY